MPIRGAKPKPPGQAVTRNKRLDWDEVPNVAFTPTHTLPATRWNGQPWPEAALQMWAVWSTMPHCVLWSESDWQFCLESVEAGAAWAEKLMPTYGAELRARQKIMGTTADYRRDLRIRYVNSDGSEALDSDAAVARLDDYRDL